MIYYKNADFTIYRAKDKARQKISYINLPGAIDIETSEFNNKAWLYIWQIGIDDIIVYGRTPEELQDCFYKIITEMNLSYNYRLVLFSHNLKYDFSFLKGYLQVSCENSTNASDWIAKSNREIIKALVYGCIELRCSEAYTEQPLEELGKLVGLPKLSINYDLIRTPETELTPEEFNYAARDIEILLEYFRIQIDPDNYGAVKNLPLSATGRVRKDLDRYARKQDSNFDRRAIGINANSNIYAQKNYHIDGVFKDSIDETEKRSKKYKNFNFIDVIKRATFGGYTYTNKRLVGFDNTNIRSVDFNSQYPAMMIFNKYPLSTFKMFPCPSPAYYNRDYKINRVRKEGRIELIQAVFYNIEAKSDLFRFLPRNKAVNWIKAKAIDNKLQSAEAVRYVLTDIDFELVLHCYDFDNMIVEKVWSSTAGLVPDYYSEMILSLYDEKNQLKDYRSSLNRSTTPEEDQQYMEVKRHLNRLSYGLCVQDPEHKIRKFNDETKQIEIDLNSREIEFRKYTRYQWGAYCTAYGRYAIISIISKLTEGGKNRNVLYCDTDSIKYRDTPDNNDIITQYNINFKTRIFHICQKKQKQNPYFNYDKLKKLGEVQDEGVYSHFKIGGMKAYYYIKNDLTSKIVVSGMNRSQSYFHTVGIEDGRYYDISLSTATNKHWITEEEARIINYKTLNEFNPNAFIKSQYHPRRSFFYSDTPSILTVSDYHGREATVETSGFCLYRYTDFQLNPDPIEVIMQNASGDLKTIIDNIVKMNNQ